MGESMTIDVERIMRGHNLTAAQLARHLGVSEAAVSRWRSGTNTPQGLYAARLAELEATLALRDASRNGCSPAALVATLVEQAAPVARPEASDYERGYREGYRAALATILGAVAEPHRAHAPTQAGHYDRDSLPRHRDE